MGTALGAGIQYAAQALCGDRVLAAHGVCRVLFHAPSRSIPCRSIAGAHRVPSANYGTRRMPLLCRSVMVWFQFLDRPRNWTSPPAAVILKPGAPSCTPRLSGSLPEGQRSEVHPGWRMKSQARSVRQHVRRTRRVR